MTSMDNTPLQQQPLVPKKKWYEVLPPWISASCAVFGIWALFFSPASRTLVDYLQSEITARNNRISLLEARERELQISISDREKELKSLGLERDSLQKQIARDTAEQKELLARIGKAQAELSDKDFSLAKEEIASQMEKQGTFLYWQLQREIDSPNGSRARREPLWTRYLKFIQEEAARLPDNDKGAGQKVVQRFVEQCNNLRNSFVDVPAIKFPRYDTTDYDKKEKLYSQQTNALITKIFDEQKRIISCFRGVVQK